MGMFHDFFDPSGGKFLHEKNAVASGFALLSGGAIGIYIMSDTPSLTMLFSWATVVKSLFGIGTAVITLIATTIAKELYDYSKPKVIKYSKKIIIKCFKHEGKTNKRRA